MARQTEKTNFFLTKNFLLILNYLCARNKLREKTVEILPDTRK
jgi:hypothetical protein